MEGLKDKQEKMFLEDVGTITAITDLWEINNKDSWEVFDKVKWVFLDNKKRDEEKVGWWIADLMMWNGKEISEEEYRKKLGDKASESKVL